MKNKIHPDLKETTITCACGKEFKTKTTRENIRIEVCSNCHPVYTGTNKKSTSGGRIERFNEKFGLNEEAEEESDVENVEEQKETEEEPQQDQGQNEKAEDSK